MNNLRSLAALSIGLTLAGSAWSQQTVKPALSFDQAWAGVQAPAALPPLPAERPADPLSIKQILDARAAAFVAKADQAKEFYATYPSHAKANEARLVEVQALVSATQSGDAKVDGRLAALIQTLRDDKSMPVAIRVQGVAAYSFARQMRGAKTHEERLIAIEGVARSLIVEFSDQPQGYESLLTVAMTTPDETRSRKIAQDLMGMPTPARTKIGARDLLSRFDLTGKSLGAELDGADAKEVKAALESRPTIVFTWASASPGSLALAADLKKWAPAANIIALNVDSDTKKAEAVAAREAIVGKLVYDERGLEGSLAQRLGIKSPSQVILVDAQGIIRDVRGEIGLKAKLQQFGL